MTHRLTGRVGEAIDLYLDLARVHKTFPHVHFKLGFLFLAINDYHNAVRHFSAEISQCSTIVDSATKPHDGSDGTPHAQMSSHRAHSPRTFLLCAHVGRREASVALGDTDAAENDRLHVVNRGGGTLAALIAMGTLFCDLGLLQRAEWSFDQCSELNAEDPDYLIAHADLCLAQKRYAKAESMYEKCRAACHSSSALFHRAFIGQGTALLRNQKLQDAAVLLLQAMNGLRTLVRDRSSGIGQTDASTGSTLAGHNGSFQAVMLYHQAMNLYGGVCLLLGNLKTALDTFASAARHNGYNEGPSLLSFSLPLICVLPGTKDARGNIIDSSKLTVANLTELVRHLDEIEWRYGPDPCLYFHRANAHRALGELRQFVHDLSMVEMMEPDFMRVYLSRDCFGDFLDVETISWLPAHVVEAIHQSLTKGEYKPPIPPTGLIGRPHSMIGLHGRNASKGRKKVSQKPTAVFSEFAIFEYFQQRVNHRTGLDEYAQVYQLDILRRLPISRTSQAQPDGDSSDHLSEWEGADLDKLRRGFVTEEGEIANRVVWCREMVKAALVKHGQHPFVHMAAGMIELELCNASIAQLYFTEALDKVERRLSALTSVGSPPRLATLASNWQQNISMRMKYYCLVWRSLACRLRVEMDHAVEDLNVAAAVKLSVKSIGATDPLLLSQRSLIMLLNGHLKSAHKLLRHLERRVRIVLRQQLIKRRGNTEGLGELIAVTVVDMLSNAGLNSFHLLPATVEREFRRLPSAYALLVRPTEHANSTVPPEESKLSSDEEDGGDNDVAGSGPLQTTPQEEERAVAIIKSTLAKRTTPPNSHGSTILQTETLDKFFESGLRKLALTGRLEQAIPFFLAALLVDEHYLPPTNFASLELLKCKENEFVEEKLYNCFVQLSKRSRWLVSALGWRFEAMVDANLANAYLPTDTGTLWHRAKLFQESCNFAAAITDLSGCLNELSSQVVWKRSTKKRRTMIAVFQNETKRTQWLQLLLQRGQLEMATLQWGEAIGDFTMLVDQADGTNLELQIRGLENRGICLIHLQRYADAIQDLQHQRVLVRKKNEHAERSSTVAGLDNLDSDLLPLLLIGNLYCQLALDQIQLGSKSSLKEVPGFNPVVAEQLKALHRNSGFLQRAAEYFFEARVLAPTHFLVHFCLGRMFAISRQPRLAIDSLSECLRFQPLFLPAIFLRGCIYAQEQLIYLGLADLYRVRHRAPSYLNLHTSIGYCHFQRGDMGKAVKSLTEALEVDSKDASALYLRGCALQELFVLDSAEKDFTQILHLEESHSRALYQRSVCAALRQQYAVATGDLETLIRHESEWADVWILHAYTSFCLKRYDSAILSYSHAIKFHDGSSCRSARSGESSHTVSGISLLYTYRAFALMQVGDLRGAMDDLDLAVKRDNGNSIAFIAKAYLLTQAKELAKVTDVLLHALQNTKKMNLLPASELKIAGKRARGSPVTGSIDKQDATSGSLGAFSPRPSRGNISMKVDCNTSSEAPKHPKRGTSSNVIFRKRKEDRDNELSRYLSAINTPTNRAAGIRNAQQLLSSPRGNQKATHGEPEAINRSLSLESNNNTSTSTASRNDTRSKVVRVVKRMMFEHRVLKALKSTASSNYRKDQQRVQVLAEVLQPASSVAWPKGTHTTNLLVWAYNTLGILQFSERNVDDALMAFTLAMQADATAAMTSFNRGNVYLHMNVLHSSMSGFQDAIEIDDCYIQAYNNLGVTFYHMDRLGEAQEAFSSGLCHAEEDKQKAVLLYNLGVICQIQGKPDEAIDLYQQAIRLDGSRAEFFNNRSSILHQQLKFTVALDDYNRALMLPTSPKNRNVFGGAGGSQLGSAEALLNRAQLFISMGSCANAIRDLKLVLSRLVHLQGNQEPSFGSTATSLGSPAFSSSLRLTSRARFSLEDEQLVSKLLAFCEQWHRALQIAVNDFLFALESLPFLAKYQLCAVAEAVQRQAVDDNGNSNDNRNHAPGSVFVLPIEDTTFFNYDVDLKAQIKMFMPSDSFTYETPERDQEAVQDQEHICMDDGSRVDNEFIRELFHSHLGDDLKQACRECATGNLDAAARFLLRAHYKTTIDSHEEYAIMLWRMQVVLAAGQEEGATTALPAVIRQLCEFLAERQTPEEAAFVNAYGHYAAPKPSRQHSVNFDDDVELSSSRDVAWQKQKRVVRADAFTYLGGLYQLNGQKYEARAAFAHALHLRRDHVFALVNFLQLCILSSDHETSLGSIVNIIEILSSSDHASGKSSNTTCGLLNADRSVVTMLSPAFEAFSKSDTLVGLASQLLSTIKEYRGLVTSHIESNRSQIIRKQGVVARQAHELREAFETAALTLVDSHSSHIGGVSEIESTLNLEALDSLVDEYIARVAAAPGDFTVEESYKTFNAAFEDEFAHVCERILDSLPQDDRSPLVASSPTTENMPGDSTECSLAGNEVAAADATPIPSPLKSTKRAVALARPSTTPLRWRRHTRQSNVALADTLNASMDKKATPMRPIRPMSGPITAQVKYHTFGQQVRGDRQANSGLSFADPSGDAPISKD